MTKLTFLLTVSLSAQPALQFEVASVRPSPPITEELTRSGLPIGMRIVGNRVTIGFVSMSGLLQWAYEVKEYQISGPAWIDGKRFNIEATLPAGVGKEQFPALLRGLLEERFHLKVHKEPRETPVYLLTQSPSGIKAKIVVPEPSRQEATEPGGVIPTTVKNTMNGEVFSSERGTLRRTSGPNGVHVEWDRISLPDYAEMLASSLSTPVLDRTGLRGSYVLFVEYPPQSPREPAIQETFPKSDLVGTVVESVRTLGLRLERGKAQMDHIVVDKLDEMPSDN